jgi:hypothetical protein
MASTYTGQHKHRKVEEQTSIPRAEFEPIIPVFEWSRTLGAFDPVATVIGCLYRVIHL